MSARGARRATAGVVLLVGLGAGAGLAYSTWRNAEPAGPPSELLAAPAERVRVEVLNSGGVSGRARAATDDLRRVGFDVVQFGNARSFDRDSSVVIDRVGRLDLASAVANALGIPNVLAEPDSNLYVDVTVLLGRDWSGRPRERVDGGESPRRAPWDPRGWLDH